MWGPEIRRSSKWLSLHQTCKSLLFLINWKRNFPTISKRAGSKFWQSMSSCNSMQNTKPISGLKEAILGLIPISRVTHRSIVNMAGTESIQCLKVVHIVLSASIKRVINVYKKISLFIPHPLNVSKDSRPPPHTCK